MPAVVTIVFLLYALLLGAFGASLLVVAIAGGTGVLWQVCASLARGFVPPALPAPDEPEILTEEDLLHDRDLQIRREELQ